MAYTSGRCTNELYCAAASAGQTLRVPIGGQFVCPQCGKALIEPAPHGPTRDFSPIAIAGGAPAYPPAYEGEGRTGRVTVSCRITQSGAPAGCHVVASKGGVAFSNAALGWLRSGGVRFAPVLRDGQPQAGEHSWTMNFVP